VWSYGADTQPTLEKYIRLRAVLKPYITELAKNVSERGVPTVRPLWWEFPTDSHAVGVSTQYMLGPDYLVAPVTVENATNRSVYFPGDKAVRWYHVFDGTVVEGGQAKVVPAPLEIIPVYTTRPGRMLRAGSNQAL
jgi:alpha-glucosidase (family GH31 glycosyl hydrolase)